MNEEKDEPMTDEELGKKFNTDRLREIAEPRSEDAVRKAEERKRNRNKNKK